MKSLTHVIRQRRPHTACIVFLLGAAIGGWLNRHRVAYDIQVRRGDFVVRSIPRDRAAEWLTDTLRSASSAAQRQRAARFLRHFTDQAHAGQALVGALGDPDLAVQEAAYKGLVALKDVCPESGVPRFTGVPTGGILLALKATRCNEASYALFRGLEDRDRASLRDAARHILSASADEALKEYVFYRLGAPAYCSIPHCRPMLMEAWGPLPLLRHIAAGGLQNPVEATRIRCARFLVLLGGLDLCEWDKRWIDDMRADQDLLLDALGTFEEYWGSG